MDLHGRGGPGDDRPRPGFLRAVVRRTDRKRIGGLNFKVTDADGRVPVRVVLSNEPNHRDPLAPGTRRMEIRGKGIETTSREFEVHEGEETAIEVEPKPGPGAGR